MVRIITPIIESGDRVREGKGFSKEELGAVELTLGEAKRRGIPVDSRRRSSHDENVETLKEFLEETENVELKVQRPKQFSKPHVGRVHKGRTSAGQKMRYLSRRK
ncbi:ribosomal protein L13e [Candidatus Bathyarchaeota archaeon]|nr:ribosomal protein L13e [Candidatus Bathyarchaeota archaeon]